MTECEICGDNFESEHGVKIHQSKVHKSHKYMDEDWLREKYESERLDIFEIAELCDAGERTIQSWMNKFDIDGRRGGMTLHPSIYTHNTGYVHANCGVNREQVKIHRLLAISKYGFDEVCDMQVHHKKPIPWLNTPENITILSPSEHASIEFNEPFKSNVKITGDICDKMRDRYNSNPSLTQAELAEEYNVDDSQVCRHINGKCHHS